MDFAQKFYFAGLGLVVCNIMFSHIFTSKNQSISGYIASIIFATIGLFVFGSLAEDIVLGIIASR